MFERLPHTREEPFPERGQRDPADWAREVVWLWTEAGRPVLLGVPAEQLHEARRILGV
jgi:hypothetical protein